MGLMVWEKINLRKSEVFQGITSIELVQLHLQIIYSHYLAQWVICTRLLISWRLLSIV